MNKIFCEQSGPPEKTLNEGIRIQEAENGNLKAHPKGEAAEAAQARRRIRFLAEQDLSTRHSLSYGFCDPPEQSARNHKAVPVWKTALVRDGFENSQTWPHFCLFIAKTHKPQDQECFCFGRTGRLQLSPSPTPTQKESRPAKVVLVGVKQKGALNLKKEDLTVAQQTDESDWAENPPVGYKIPAKSKYKNKFGYSSIQFSNERKNTYGLVFKLL